MAEDNTLSPHGRAILAEISAALERLIQTGESHTIFINKMGLVQQDRETIHELLGQGGVKVKIENTDEPAEWIESGISGIWFGVFFDHAERPLLETIEIAAFPPVASAQPEDMQCGAIRLKNLLEN